MLEHKDYYRNGMGTENVGPLLRSLIQMTRPMRILEIGAGYTTPFILEAIEKNKELFDDNSGCLNKEYAENHKKTYDPKFVIIDDKSYGEFDMINKKYVHYVEGKFQKQSQYLFDTYGLFDFVWFDCGREHEYFDFITEYWDICSKYVIFHQTYSHQKPNVLLTAIAGKTTGNPQRIDILEPHKDHQGSITIYKKCAWDVRK
jgi:hypothetical protein